MALCGTLTAVDAPEAKIKVEFGPRNLANGNRHVPNKAKVISIYNKAKNHFGVYFEGMRVRYVAATYILNDMEANPGGVIADADAHHTPEKITVFINARLGRPQPTPELAEAFIEEIN